jgi:hypothetical protein
LTWRQWVAAAIGCGLLYGAVRFSPLSQKWTFTATLLLLAAITVTVLPLTGNALGFDRYLAAIIRWTLGTKHFHAIADAPGPPRGGVLLTTIPITPSAPAGGMDADGFWRGDIQEPS